MRRKLTPLGVRALVTTLFCGLGGIASQAADDLFQIKRVTTIAPFPRGLAMVDGRLYVLCRGCVRGAGGVRAEVEDRAGRIYVVDPDTTEAIATANVSDVVRRNGSVFAWPTEPPFRLWDRTAIPPASDRNTDRPYCTLRYHDPTRSFYICAFSGIDKPKKPGEVSFSKNLTDAILRYDLRTEKWYEVERHNLEAGGSYPHHDTRYFPPPHGWLNGPDNLLTVGNWLYAVAKENNLLVRYDLSHLIDDAEAGAPPSEVVLRETIRVKGLGRRQFYGHSALAFHDGRLYIGFRTSSVILRIPLDENGLPVQPIVAELLARFEPYDPVTRRSANLTDMAFDSKGRLYVVSAKPARVYRFKPDPSRVFDARVPNTRAWLDLAAATGNPKMKSENILIDDRDRLFVTSGDGYDFQYGANGTVYRITWREE